MTQRLFLSVAAPSTVMLLMLLYMLHTLMLLLLSPVQSICQRLNQRLGLVHCSTALAADGFDLYNVLNTQGVQGGTIHMYHASSWQQQASDERRCWQGGGHACVAGLAIQGVAHLKRAHTEEE